MSALGSPDWRPSWAVMGRPYVPPVSELLQGHPLARLANNPATARQLANATDSMRRMALQFARAAQAMGPTLRDMFPGADPHE